MVHAIRVHKIGGPEVLTWESVDVPAPGPGQVRLKQYAIGVNYIDTYQRSGLYSRSQTYQTPLPMTLGSEGGGTVVALGEGVTGLGIGERVAYCIVRGAYAEHAAVPAWRLVKVPEDLPLEIGTALMLQGLTAHYLSHSAFALSTGHTCLVHAGAGGVGQLLIQLAKLRGATVIATSSTIQSVMRAP